MIMFTYHMHKYEFAFIRCDYLIFIDDFLGLHLHNTMARIIWSWKCCKPKVGNIAKSKWFGPLFLIYYENFWKIYLVLLLGQIQNPRSLTYPKLWKIMEWTVEFMGKSNSNMFGFGFEFRPNTTKHIRLVFKV